MTKRLAYVDPDTIYFRERTVKSEYRQKLIDAIARDGYRSDRPIRVRQMQNGDLILLDGSRRLGAVLQLRASGDQRFYTIPCIIYKEEE